MKNSFYFVAFRTLLLLTVLTVVWGERDINYNWNNVFPPCIANETNLEYEGGKLSAQLNFFKCASNIVDAPGLPVLRDGELIGTMLVNSSIQLNNLHSVDPLSGSMTIDFYWRVFWHDKRFHMPVFWERMPDYLRTRGLDLSRLKDHQDGPLIWIPDLRFHDATDLKILVEGIRVNEEGRIFWSRHVVATFMQPMIDVTAYPSDRQVLHLRYGSYVYDKEVLMSGFLEGTNPISLNKNFDGSASFKQNALWTYREDLSSYEFYESSSNYHNTVYHIYLDREGSGVITRLILPMTLLLLLSGVTFWACPETRVESTTTLLLAVSALYIVILGNIPLVGYLTYFDQFVFWMFLLLIVVASMHQVYSTLNAKLDMWPLRRVYLRAMQGIGRIAVFPTVILVYVHFIHGKSEKGAVLWQVLATIIILVVTCVEVPAIHNSAKRALRELSEKIATEETTFKKISKFEILVINYIRYHKISTDFEMISLDLKQKRRLSLTKNRDIKLTDTATIRNRQHRNVTKALETLTQHVRPSPRTARAGRAPSGDSDDEDFQDAYETVPTGGSVELLSRSFEEEDAGV